jgi:hypothetical protein
MKTKEFITLLAVAVVLGGVIGGALAGGIAIGKGQANQTSQSSSLTTGLGNFQLPGNNRGIVSGNVTTIGTVDKVEGTVITLNTRVGTVTVNVGNNTSIQKMSKEIGRAHV